jgi:ABC-2 type transport system permease protein
VGALIIPAGFSAALRGPRPTAHVTYYTVTANRDVSAQVAQDTVQAVVQRFSFQELTQAAVLKAQSGGAANRAVARQLAQQAVVALDRRPPVAMQTVNATTHKASGPDNTVPGFALMFALFGLMAGAGSILEEKEAGTFRRLLIAPLAPQALLAGKLLAQFLQAMVQLAVLFGVGALLFKIDLGSAPLALVLLIIATSFAATGLGLVLVSFIRSQRQLRPITTLIVLSFSALGGSWWPLSIEPQWMQSLSKITITSWAMQGFNGLMIFDKTFMQVLPDIVALFIYGLICISISRRTFRFVEA